MSTDYLSSLPAEMLDEISTFFQHDYTLDPSFLRNNLEPKKSYRALAQTCKSLCAHFQHRLFSNIDLSAETSILKLAEIVQNNPVLASYIRIIDLGMDTMCMGFFQYPPLLAIMHVSSSSGTPPEIRLYIEALWIHALPSITITHILNAPQTILYAITDFQVSMGWVIPVGLFRLLPNLRVVCGSRFILSSKDYSAEDHTSQSQFFHPKLNVLMLKSCHSADIKMLCEQILDLSTLKELVVSRVHTGTTGVDHLNAKRLLAWRILDHAPLVQRLQFDIGVGPFYDLGRLQRLRQCTFDLKVEADANPAPHLCQLLRTLPPLLEYLHLSFKFIDILLNENNVASSHVLFSISTWSDFDAALDDVVASGTRPFRLTLAFCIHTPLNDVAKPFLTNLFIDWGRKYLPKSSRQRNLTIVFNHSYPDSP
ncbi:hypothetical protein BDN70DRAFT_998965 [Pholiota conissans]|uniref:F-box domain-containing protein n=1 Tax=Pholiota conissans TaxID=109636 RepID=A0A9P5YK05_9AGAR|nr:hypothetical protein BDN70DRAFT_998965 [Pholiota conissans]